MYKTRSRRSRKYRGGGERNHKKSRKYKGGLGWTNKDKSPEDNLRNWRKYWSGTDYPEYDDNINYPGRLNKLVGVKPTPIPEQPSAFANPESIVYINKKQQILQDMKRQIDPIPIPSDLINRVTSMATQGAMIKPILTDLKESLNDSIITEQINPNDTYENVEEKKKYIVKLLYISIFDLIRTYTTANYGKTNKIIDDILSSVYENDMTEVQIIWQKMLKVVANLTTIEKLSLTNVLGEYDMNLNPKMLSPQAWFWESSIDNWSKCKGKFEHSRKVLLDIIFNNKFVSNKYTKDLIEYANAYKKRISDCGYYENPLTGEQIYGGTKRKSRR